MFAQRYQTFSLVSFPKAEKGEEDVGTLGTHLGSLKSVISPPSLPGTQEWFSLAADSFAFFLKFRIPVGNLTSFPYTKHAHFQLQWSCWAKLQVCDAGCWVLEAAKIPVFDYIRSCAKLHALGFALAMFVLLCLGESVSKANF